MIFRSTYQTIRDSIRKISAGYGIMWFAHVLHGAFQNEHKNAKWNVNLLYEAFTNCSMTAKPGEQTTKKQMTVQYFQ